MPSAPLLEIKNLNINFRTEEGITKAVDGIDFTLKKGSILGIVGESGSGKSVTALSVLKLLQSPPAKITADHIWFHPKDQKPTDLFRLTENKLRNFRGNKISMIFQEPMTSLNPVYRCGRQVSEAIRLHLGLNKKKSKKRVISLFEELKLPGPKQIYRLYPYELSGGQKQRVMIAMAMACNPEILIADEPTTALDATVQKSILESLKNLQEKHATSIIFITHDLGIIANIADEVLIMFQGKIVEHGSTHQIFKNPQHPYTKGLIACRPQLDTDYLRLPTVNDFLNKSESFIRNIKKQKQQKRNYAKANDLLQTNNLSTWFRIRAGFFKPKELVRAVDKVSMNVKQGETLGLVGESGCGKTTLGRTILRLIEPTHGKIIYKNLNLTKLSKSGLRKQRKNIQIIFQDPYSSLNPRITIGSAIQEPMKVFKLHGSSKKRKNKTFALLEKVGLNREHYNRYPHEFSGGQRQRICIARALAVEPEFIICDESVSALDVSIQAQILNLLNDLKDEFGFSYIFISHNLAVVKYMSDRIAVMKDGKILETDKADEVYKHPNTDYTKRLIDSIPGL